MRWASSSATSPGLHAPGADQRRLQPGPPARVSASEQALLVLPASGSSPHRADIDAETRPVRRVPGANGTSDHTRHYDRHVSQAATIGWWTSILAGGVCRIPHTPRRHAARCPRASGPSLYLRGSAGCYRPWGSPSKRRSPKILEQATVTTTTSRGPLLVGAAQVEAPNRPIYLATDP